MRLRDVSASEEGHHKAKKDNKSILGGANRIE